MLLPGNGALVTAHRPRPHPTSVSQSCGAGALAGGVPGWGKEAQRPERWAWVGFKTGRRALSPVGKGCLDQPLF